MAMVDTGHLHFTTLEQLGLSGSAVKRLLMSCAMGGIVGFEREWHHKDSGLRTNMLICMGACMFTIMSQILAGDSPNKGQVAANIVQGIGFLGAGLILHTKSRVLGLASAATVFVVAGIGMACGAGVYLEALIATVLVVLALQVVGTMESRLGWKRFPMIYEVRADLGPTVTVEEGEDREDTRAEDVDVALHRMQTAILQVLDDSGQRLSVLERDNIAGIERVAFTVVATKKRHARMLKELRANDATDKVVAFHDKIDE